MDLCEFKASLVYRASPRTARAPQRDPVLEISMRQVCWLRAVPLAVFSPQTDPFLGMMMGLGGGMDFDSKKAYR